MSSFNLTTLPVCQDSDPLARRKERSFDYSALMQDRSFYDPFPGVDISSQPADSLYHPSAGGSIMLPIPASGSPTDLLPPAWPTGLHLEAYRDRVTPAAGHGEIDVDIDSALEDSLSEADVFSFLNHNDDRMHIDAKCSISHNSLSPVHSSELSVASTRCTSPQIQSPPTPPSSVYQASISPLISLSLPPSHLDTAPKPKLPKPQALKKIKQVKPRKASSHTKRGKSAVLSQAPLVVSLPKSREHPYRSASTSLSTADPDPASKTKTESSCTLSNTDPKPEPKSTIPVQPLTHNYSCRPSTRSSSATTRPKPESDHNLVPPSPAQGTITRQSRHIPCTTKSLSPVSLPDDDDYRVSSCQSRSLSLSSDFSIGSSAPIARTKPKAPLGIPGTGPRTGKPRVRKASQKRSEQNKTAQKKYRDKKRNVATRTCDYAVEMTKVCQRLGGKEGKVLKSLLTAYLDDLCSIDPGWKENFLERIEEA